MDRHLLWSISFIFSLIHHVEVIKLEHRKKRSHSDNFNVLLGLYKMSPLRSSNIYKKFSDQILLPSRFTEQSDVLHFDSNESVRENRTRIGKNLKHIEEVIHATNAPIKQTGLQYYSVENKVPEFFSEDSKTNYLFKEMKTAERPDDTQFKNIFEHIGSNEVDIPSTKLIPVNTSLPKEYVHDNKKELKGMAKDIFDGSNAIDEGAVVILR